MAPPSETRPQETHDQNTATWHRSTTSASQARSDATESRTGVAGETSDGHDDTLSNYPTAETRETRDMDHER